MRPLIGKFIEEPNLPVPVEWKSSPNTVKWQAIERVLLRLRNTAPADRQASVERLFHHLGYAEFYQSLLSKGNRWKRALAAERLGAMGASAASIEALIQALRDPSKEVRSIALRSLAQMADERSISFLVKELPRMVHPETGVYLATLKNAMIRMGESLLPVLLPHLETDDPHVLCLVADGLGEIGSKEATPYLIRLLTHPDPEVRAKTAKAIGKIHDPSAVPALLAMDREPVWYVRLQVCHSLGLLGDERGIDFLKDRLVDESWQVRAAAAEALIKIGPPALPSVVRMLQENKDRYAREQIAEELQRSGMVEELIHSLGDPDDPLLDLKRSLFMALVSLGMTNFLRWVKENHPSVGVRREVSLLLESAESSEGSSHRRTE
ncbi:MAG: HEAT repeat domain-containing protein [Desulfobacterota bacterium]|nr:HEAT repeat domain-containing protein [Thermodesulfobacteriota bacterium]